MMTINEFKERCGMTKIEVKQIKGREFAETPIGPVFASKDINWAEPVFIIVNDGKKAGYEHLKGSFWFVNSKARITRTL